MSDDDDMSDALAAMQLVEVAVAMLRDDPMLLVDAQTATGSGAKLAAILSRDYGVPLDDCEWAVLAAVQKLHDE